MKAVLLYLLAILSTTCADASFADEKPGPGFKLKSTYHYEATWDDRGSGASRSVAIWLANPKKEGNDESRPLGSIAYSGYERARFDPGLLVGGDPNVESPAVKAPVSYTLIWKDTGSGSDKDGSFWRPVAPKGYVAVGDLGQRGYEMPSTSRVWCLREDLVKKTIWLYPETWNDRNSKSDKDVSIWTIYPPLNDLSTQIRRGFVVFDGYNYPDSTDLALVPDLSKRAGPADITSLIYPGD